jgi:3-phenylpropionate/cinnamic acid dioxygenase small subunit
MENFYKTFQQIDRTTDSYLNHTKPKKKEEEEERFKIKTKDIFVVKNKKIKSPKYKKPKFKLGNRIKSMFKNEMVNY